MVSNDRWVKAQSYEKSYWEKSAKRIEQGEGVDLSWYNWKAGWLVEKLNIAFADEPLILNDKAVIEVGSGPVGVISFIDAKVRYAVDPLCDFYAEQAALAKDRSKDVKYLNSQGERLQFGNEEFDLGILDNVIDHVQNADSVMKEVNRVLKNNSALFFTVNVHPFFGYFLHRIVSVLKIDKGHPHTFTERKAVSFLSKHGFEVLYKETENYWDCVFKDLKSKSLKDKIKAITGLSEYLCICVAVKK